MSHQPASTKTGDYFNIPHNPPPEVVRNDTSDLEVDSSQAPESYPGRDKASYQNYHNYHGAAADQIRVLGLKPRMFWLMIFLISIIFAIGIGAGVGAGISSKNKNRSSISSTTPTPSALPSDSKNKPSTTDVTCPANDTLAYTPSSSASSSSNAYSVNATTLTYTIHCGYTYDSSKDIDDFQWFPNTNLTACIDLCSVYNVQYPYGGGEYGFNGLCSGVTVIANKTCQLKMGVQAGAVNVDKKGDGESAMLVWY